ncbi:accessory Sec system protein Asp1 [Gemelliphila palaticanis]|uniref:Accessory Sec system protein Asp1 n=1 Tax=Gemelliphila palaticanis TaxID=81950 RepID=A0ABX2T324_9BACL|nr:accessory Sec system protein Asp1 [Gemella palaticanis]MBF0716098.1 accessory Sec system protein Asp1 [Gemella palaticanis]NYS48028.1 accessory Sec system protein Asp1 [Gemella palaticanis]
MFHFIPSWYNEDRTWYDSSTVFYRATVNREFDDTIHQIKLFRSAKEKFNLFVLNYSPNLREFLNRHNIYGIDYISVFDVIQNTENINSRLMQINDFLWDEDVEFVYTPFLIMVLKENKKYANINFTHTGNIMFIDFFENDVILKKYVMDDRGFLSSILYYENGLEKYQEYLNIHGIWQIREHLQSSKKVEVNEYSDYNFNKNLYNNIEELIIEIMNNNILLEDKIICAASNINSKILLNNLKNKNVILSFFENRFNYLDKNILSSSVQKSKILVADTQSTYDKLISIIPEEDKNKLNIITPYDTRLLLGKSQRKKELIIYLLSDISDKEFLKNIIIKLIKCMEKDSRIHLCLGTYKKFIDEKSLNSIVEDILLYDFEDKYYIKEEDKNSYENSIDSDEDERKALNIKTEIINTELDLIKALEYTRLIVDLSDYPDVLTSIIGISSGVPQINLVNNDYVENYKNGIIIKDLDELPVAINYYFKGLENWNRSLVYSVEKLLEYTSSRIVNDWKLLLKD